MNLTVPHCGHGGEGHVERVERRVAVDPGEPDGADREGGGDGHHDEEKTAREPAHGMRHDKYSVAAFLWRLSCRAGRFIRPVSTRCRGEIRPGGGSNDG